MAKLGLSLYEFCMKNEDKKYLLDEWDYEKNSKLGLNILEIASGSHKKAFWKCNNGHSFEQRIDSRSCHSVGCPYCSNQKVLKGYNDLCTTHPKLVEEWDFNKNNIKPDEISKGSNKKVWWLCKEGHSFEQVVSKRTMRNQGCPYCSGRNAIKGETDLCTTHPELVKEWDFNKNNIRPDEISKGSHQKVWWICKKGHSYDMTVANRTSGFSCPYCSGQKVLDGYNDLCTTHPNLIKKWDFEKNIIKPNEISGGSGQSIWWKCDKGHSYIRKMYVMTSYDSKCPYCSGHKVLVGFNDLATTHPELIKEWNFSKNNIKPTEISKGYSKKVWWLCNNGHSYYMRASDRIKGLNCPYCSGQKVLKGYNDFATLYPHLLKEWDFNKNNIKPDEVTSGSGQKVWWLCKEGHSFEQAIVTRTSQNCSCPYCSGRRVIKGETDLCTTNPELVKEWDFNKNKISPDEVSKGSSQKVWWICEKGHSYKSIIYSRAKGVGCPICQKEKHSSFPEQSLFYYIHKCIPSVISREIEILKEYKFEIDIYIPKLKIGIEYDGYRWHKNKSNIDRDNRKDLACKEKGITLIRVREDGLISLKNSINIFRKDNYSDEVLEQVIKEVLLKIGINTDVNIERDRQIIYSQYMDMEKENSLAVKFPKIAKEWHPIKNGYLKPENISFASNKKVWWQCEKGHEYQKAVNVRIKNKIGCPYCVGTKILKGFNDFESSYPELMKEWDFEKNVIKPDEIFKTSSKKVWWKCEKCGYSWQSQLNTRVIQKVGCSVCNKNYLLQGYNDFATLHSELLEEWDFEKNIIKPTETVKGSGKKIWWICPNGHSYASTIYHRLEGKGCLQCYRDRARKKVINLDTKEIFNSITEACLSIGQKSNLISRCCKGKAKTAGGYHWAYYEEKE